MHNKYPYLGLLLNLLLFSCNNPEPNNQKLCPVVLNEDVALRFRNVIIIDTSNCPKFFYSRPIVDSFVNEMAFIKLRHQDSGDTVITTKKFRSLFICNLPYFNKQIDDTILISGKVYVVRGDERMPGNPTILFEIRTKNSSKK